MDARTGPGTPRSIAGARGGGRVYATAHNALTLHCYYTRRYCILTPGR